MIVIQAQTKSGRNRIARIGDKYYDMGTSNKSFIQVAKDLKSLGIKNCLFMLEIKDPSLIGIDPFSVDKTTKKCNLTQDQVSRIMTECYRNPWYYLREVCRIKDPGGISVPYLANRGNIAQAWCIWKGYDSWLCLPRQKGKTQSALAMQTWCYLFGTSNSEFIFVNKDGDAAKTNLRRLADQIELLPEYLHLDTFIDPETGKREKGKNNATRIDNPINGNSIIVKPSASSYEKALSLARGLTAPILYFDEPEFTRYIKTIVANSVSTYEQAARAAKRNHAMYARIFTCTPGDLSTKEGVEAQMLLDRTIKWSETIYDKTPEQVQELIEAQGKDCNQIFYIEYSYKQIGETEEWLRNISGKIGDPLVVRREVLLQRLHGSSASPYSQEDLEYIAGQEHKPISELWIRDYYRFDIYEELSKEIPYLVGIDCSTGTGGDNNAITVVNPYTLEPAAEFECSYIGETKYIAVITDLVKFHIPRAILCIERNSMGDAIVDFLLHTPLRRNLYYDKNKDLLETKVQENETIESMLKKEAAKKLYYGVYTGPKSREDMFAILSRHVNEYKEKFVAHNVIRDLTRLVRTPSGKIEAAKATDENGDPFHDDSIMSYLIALYVYYHGNNLALFGLELGLKDEDIKHEGTQRPITEADKRLLNPELVDQIMEQQNSETNKMIEADMNYTEMMIAAAKKSQQESYRMSRSGFVQNTQFDADDVMMDDFDDDDESYFDQGLLFSLNGINN